MGSKGRYTVPEGNAADRFRALEVCSMLRKQGQTNREHYNYCYRDGHT